MVKGVIAPDVGGGFGYKGILLMGRLRLGMTSAASSACPLDRRQAEHLYSQRQLSGAPLQDHCLC